MSFIKPKFIPERTGIYLAGGCVRDRMLGRATADYDVAVDGDAQGVARTIASRARGRVVVMGEGSKRVYRVVANEGTYDVSEIKGADITADLMRRDFTINAMAVNAATGELFDPAGGRKDLKRRLVRMVCPEAFDADPLRLLRTFRMAAVLGFSIDPETIAAIFARAEKIVETAGERIREEWLAMLQSTSSADLIELMQRSGLLYAMFPETRDLRDCIQNRYHLFDAFDHTMAVYRAQEKMLHENRPALYPGRQNTYLLTPPATPGLLKHAALFHDIGKPGTRSIDDNGNIHFFNHDKKGADMVSEINRRLRFSNEYNSYVSFLIKNHLRPLFLYLLHKSGKLQPKIVTRFFIRTAPWTPDLLLLTAADSAGKDPSAVGKFTEFTQNLVWRYFNEHLPASGRPRLITGHDLIEKFGLKPSPLFSKILEKVEELRLAGVLKNRDQALDFTGELLDKYTDK